jgi:outer membrane cobalamin receptor
MIPRTIALLLVAIAVPVLAEEVAEQVDTIVVTGSRATDQQAEIPNTMTVIRLEEIEAQNPVSVPDLLRRLPGVHVAQPSGQGGVARVFVRGGDQNLTMILLDGVRVNDPTDTRGSQFDFSTVSLYDIDRIEIVRGPQSAVYGSNALAGVINIISKDYADTFGGSITAEVGSDDYNRGALDLSGPIGTSGGFSLRVMSKDDGEPVAGTTFAGDSVSGRLSFAGDDAWKLHIFGNYSDSDGTAFPEDSGGSELAVIRDPDTRSTESLRFGLNGNTSLSADWDLNFLATWYDQDASYLSPGVAPGVRDAVPPNGADSNLQRSNYAVNAVVEVSEAATATFGMDYYDEDGTSDGFVEFFPGFELPAGFEFDRHVTGAFGELHYAPERGPTLMASLRRDDSSTESAETTAKVGMLYQLSNGRTSFRANWGQGFSLPGFFSLASPLVGNPDLRPETSESYDIGVTHRFNDSGTEITVALFHNEFSDLIDFEASVFQMINRDRLDVDGIEIQFDYIASENLSVHAQATYLDLKLRNDPTPLRQRPDWRAGLMLSWLPSENWTVDASWLYSGETYDTSIPTGDQFLHSYNRLDLTTTYRFADSLDVVASLENLLDEDYYEAIGFPAVGTRARLGLRYAF